MFAEKMVRKNKPTEACGRRIAQGGLIAMFAQTKRLKELGFQGEGGGSQASFPLVVPLVPFRRSGKERKKRNLFYAKYPFCTNIK
jgi:hypothetical protein